MNRLKNILFVVILLANSICLSAQKQKAAPNVFVLNPNTLLANKSKVKANANHFPAYDQLIKDADEALKFGPVSVMEKKHMPPSGDKHDYMSLAPYHWPDPDKKDGLPYIRRDGETNPEVREYKDKEYQPLLCDKVHKLALAYFFSGEKRYAKHAARLLRVWFLDAGTRMNPNLNFGQAIKGENTGRAAGLIDVRHYIKVVDAIGLLKSSKYWTEKDQAGMKQWFTEFLKWMQTSKIGIDEMNTLNNHGAWYDAIRLSLALFINDTDLAKNIVQNAQKRLDTQMDDAGRFPKEMQRTTSFHYTVFVMDAFFNIAQMAEKLEVDLWKYTSPSGKSLKKAFDELLPYLSKQKEWKGQQIKPFNFEEGIHLLQLAYLKLGCSNCKQVIKSITGDKEKILLINLLY